MRKRGSSSRDFLGRRVLFQEFVSLLIERKAVKILSRDIESLFRREYEIEEA
jgi:hypothetical protein